MIEQFISPNWHVILIHYPLALLSAGILIEFFSFLGWRRSGFRAAGRWMILLGALLAIPTVTAGIYAFRSAAVPNIPPTEGHWHQVAMQSLWNGRQWDMMKNHLLLTSIATALFVAVSVLWLGASELRRRGYIFYYFLMFLLLCALGLVTTGAWYSGESVYRYGTAVSENVIARPPHHPLMLSITQAQEELDHPSAGNPQGYHWIEYYLPPLQLHVVLAGIAVALGLAALGLSVKRWDRVISSIEEPPLPATAATPEPPKTITTPTTIPTQSEVFLVRPRVFPGRYWLLAAIVAILTAVAGIWSVSGLTWAEAKPALELIRQPDHARLLWHVVGGVAVIVLPILLAAIVRFTREGKFITSLLALLFVLAVGWQIWLGVLMMYDSLEGSLTGFTPAPPPTTTPSRLQ